MFFSVLNEMKITAIQHKIHNLNITRSTTSCFPVTCVRCVSQAILGLLFVSGVVFILCLVCACVMLTPLPVAISVWEPEQPRQDVEHMPINKSHLQ